jgi:hypothetical protein
MRYLRMSVSAYHAEHVPPVALVPSKDGDANAGLDVPHTGRLVLYEAEQGAYKLSAVERQEEKLLYSRHVRKLTSPPITQSDQRGILQKHGTRFLGTGHGSQSSDTTLQIAARLCSREATDKEGSSLA